MPKQSKSKHPNLFTPPLPILLLPNPKANLKESNIRPYPNPWLNYMNGLRNQATSHSFLSCNSILNLSDINIIKLVPTILG